MHLTYNEINSQYAVKQSLPLGGDLEGFYAFNAKELDEENGMYYYSARYYAPPTFISRDPLFEKYPSISPYCYTANNPLKYVDPSGEDWYRSDESGSVFWKEGNANFVDKNGEKFRNIGETYSLFSSGMRIDYTQNEITKVTDADQQLNIEGGQYIPKQFTTDNGQKVSVSFSASSDNAISSDVISGIIKSINEANNSGANIESIKVSSTTDHSSNAKRSAHTVANGARAIDISRINNVPVSKTDIYSPILQKAIGRVPGWLENYGPSIIQKMHNGKVIPAPWARNIKGGHYDHIHYSVQKR
ncbi:MAG: RHS repeat-associated core domain-containing protein [Bacteroidales bacterium]|jgi:RHS repeat-associated protein